VAEVLTDLYDENAEERPLSIHDLKPKLRLEGTVTRIELFGAFVDVGVDKEGLVHISQLSSERVNRVSEVVNEGDQVRVWVTNVEPSSGRIDLTMIEPPAVDWDDIRTDQVYTGTIKRLERFGAFVDIGATRDGLVHVSEITSDYIRDPKDYLKAGDEVLVKVLKVDRKRRRIELSMKALEEHLAEEEEEEEGLEEAPTAMEFAWRQAQSRHKKGRGRERHKKTRAWHEQDDIFARTLRLQDDKE
jgi:small subunit ribosomal protein S1